MRLRRSEILGPAAAPLAVSILGKVAPLSVSPAPTLPVTRGVPADFAAERSGMRWRTSEKLGRSAARVGRLAPGILDPSDGPSLDTDDLVPMRGCSSTMGDEPRARGQSRAPAADDAPEEIRGAASAEDDGLDARKRGAWIWRVERGLSAIRDERPEERPTDPRDADGAEKRAPPEGAVKLLDRPENPLTDLPALARPLKAALPPRLPPPPRSPRWASAGATPASIRLNSAATTAGGQIRPLPVAGLFFHFIARPPVFCTAFHEAPTDGRCNDNATRRNSRQNDRLCERKRCLYNKIQSPDDTGHPPKIRGIITPQVTSK